MLSITLDNCWSRLSELCMTLYKFESSFSAVYYFVQLLESSFSAVYFVLCTTVGVVFLCRLLELSITLYNSWSRLSVLPVPSYSCMSRLSELSMTL